MDYKYDEQNISYPILQRLLLASNKYYFDDF